MTVKGFALLVLYGLVFINDQLVGLSFKTCRPCYSQMINVFIFYIFQQVTASKDDIKLTKEDLLEGIRVGQKYVEDLDALERDMVIKLAYFSSIPKKNERFIMRVFAVGEQPGHRRERRSGPQLQLFQIYASLSRGSGSVEIGHRSAGRPSTFEQKVDIKLILNLHDEIIWC